MNRDQSFIAACAQMRSSRDVLRNRDDAVALVEEAATSGAHYVQTPEMTGLVERDRERLLASIISMEEDITVSALRETARKRGIVVHIGSVAVTEGDAIVNRAVMIDSEGEIAATYDKIHLFDVTLPDGQRWHESATYTAGDNAIAVSTPWGQIGVSICYDLRFPLLYRTQAQAGAFCLTAPSCFTKTTGEAHWHVLQRARAIETGSFMISAAQGGLHEDGRETFGHSLIVDPWGRILAEADTQPGVILARINPEESQRTRARIPSLGLERTYPVESFSLEEGTRGAVLKD